MNQDCIEVMQYCTCTLIHKYFSSSHDNQQITNIPFLSSFLKRTCSPWYVGEGGTSTTPVALRGLSIANIMPALSSSSNCEVDDESPLLSTSVTDDDPWLTNPSSSHQPPIPVTQHVEGEGEEEEFNIKQKFDGNWFTMSQICPSFQTVGERIQEGDGRAELKQGWWRGGTEAEIVWRN